MNKVPNAELPQGTKYSTVKQSTISMHYAVVFGHFTANSVGNNLIFQNGRMVRSGSKRNRTWSVPAPNLPGSDSSISSRCPGKIEIIETIEMTRKTKVQLQYRLASHGLALLRFSGLNNRHPPIDGTPSGVAECDASLSGGMAPRAGR